MKSGRDYYDAPEWIEELMLAHWAGMTINELLETDLLWVERLQELRYQTLVQGVQLFGGFR